NARHLRQMGIAPSFRLIWHRRTRTTLSLEKPPDAHIAARMAPRCTPPTEEVLPPGCTGHAKPPGRLPLMTSIFPRTGSTCDQATVVRNAPGPASRPLS